MNIDLLRQLCETPGVPGREHRVRALIEREIDGLFDEVRTDSMGSLLAVRRSRTNDPNPLKIMLLCHMDEIGFLVTHVSEKGWIHVDPVGGFDARTLFARRVRVVTRDGEYPGVMNAGGSMIEMKDAESSASGMRRPRTRMFDPASPRAGATDEGARNSTRTNSMAVRTARMMTPADMARTT